MKKRILMLLTVVALVVAMMAVSVSPAFAVGPGPTVGSCIKLQHALGLSGQQAAFKCAFVTQDR
jgi:hypothetical protein